MPVSPQTSCLLVASVLLAGAPALAAPGPASGRAPVKAPTCRHIVFDGELSAGAGFTRAIGNGLVLYLQPIASGWILRILPAQGAAGDHDYAELATPPYQSVTPLSLSTDFAFRAQDAVGWNPRRFRFATSAESFRALEDAYLNLQHSGATPPAPVQVELSSQIAEASEGTFTILDARLIPGSADQWRMAAAVASHFTGTAHTLVPPAEGDPSPLGRLLWLRFRVDLELPPQFRVAPGLHPLPHLCGTR